MTQPMLGNDDPAPTTQSVVQDHRLEPIEQDPANAKSLKIHAVLPISQVAAVR